MRSSAVCLIAGVLVVTVAIRGVFGAFSGPAGLEDGAKQPPTTTATTPDATLNHDVVTGARCRVRCLSLLKLSIDVPLLSSVREAASLVSCLKDAECTTCLKPCNQLLQSLDRCEDVCRLPKEDRVCSESCKFLREARQPGYGVCPPLNEPNISRTEECGGRSCVSDKNCDRDLKCCVTDCGSVCRRPVRPLSDDLPEVPLVPVLREKTRGGSVELKWNSVASNETGPVLYIVDYRWNIGKHHIEANMTSWQPVAQTTSTSTMINDITPGHWYQFRVSAVNLQGTRGGSQPTQVFTLSKEPRKPGPPTNLTEGDTLIAGGKMTVTIRWFPPTKSDLPVTRYKLFWSKRQKPSTQQHNQHEAKKVLPGNRLTFQIQNIDSDATYIVQVQAICQYGEMRLKSEKASIYITTYSLPKPTDQYGVPSESAGVHRAVPVPAAVMALSVDKPFYDNGILKANVSWRVQSKDGNDVNTRKFLIHWSPEACIADSSISDDSLSRVMSSTTKKKKVPTATLR